MKVIIHGTLNGVEDEFYFEAIDLEEARQIAKEESEKRGWTNCWSETVEE